MPKRDVVRRVDQKTGGSGSGVVIGASGGVVTSPMETHVLATNAKLGDYHTISGATAGHVLRASGATTAQFAQLAHSDLSGLTTGDPHPQYVLETTTLTAGAGLTGGGDLSANRTFAVGAGAGITVNADDVALTTPGTLTVSTSNSSTGNHTHAVTASSDVGTTPAAALLKSTGAGGITLASLAVKGSVDITNNGDLTVAGSGDYAGSQVLFADSSGGNVGFLRVPDPQFTVDVAGPLRAEYLVGKQALEIEGVLLLCQYDGWAPFYANVYGQADGHRGQRGTTTTGIHFKRGKFGKAVACSPAMTNHVINPSFTASTGGWTFAETGTGGSLGRGSTLAQDDWLTGEGWGEWTGVLTASNNGSAYATASASLSIANGVAVTASCMVRGAGTLTGTFALRDTTNGNDRVTVDVGALATGWQRISCTWTNTTGGAVTVTPRMYNTGTTGNLLFTNVQIEATAFATPYNDGDMPSGAWTGTPYASTSTRGAANLAYYTSGNINQGGGTVMAWVKARTSDAAQYIVRVIGTSAGEINLYISTAGTLRGTWGTDTITSSANVGDNEWHHVAMVKGGSQLILYVDGVEVASGVSTGFSGLPATMAVGSSLAGLIDSLCIVDRVLPPTEILAVYESDAPVFAVSSVFAFRTTPTGLVWADDEGLWMRDANGNAVFGIYGDLAGGKSWGGLSLDTGDLLIGRSTQYVKWDSSAASLEVKGTIIITGGSGIAALTDAGALATADDLDDVADGATHKRTTANEKTGAGRGYSALDSGNALVTKVLPGSNIGTPAGAGLYLGADKLGYYSGSAWTLFMDNTGQFNFGGASGARLAWDGTDLFGTNGTTVQWYARASTGKLYAGGGKVIVDETGLTVDNTRTSTDAYITFTDSSATLGRIRQGWLGVYGGRVASGLLMQAISASGTTGAQIGVEASEDLGGGNPDSLMNLQAGSISATAVGGGNTTLTVTGTLAAGALDLTGKLTVGSAADSIARMRPTGTNTLADNATLTLSAAVRCVFMVFVNDGGIGLFGCNGATTIYEISDPANQFTTTAGTDGSTNVYVTGGNITLQNMENASRTYGVLIFGDTGL